jgi:hypothetical protein
LREATEAVGDLAAIEVGSSESGVIVFIQAEERYDKRMMTQTRKA